MKRSILVSGGIILALSAWVLSGSLAGSAEATPPVAPAEPVDTRMQVRVETKRAHPITREIVVQGQLEPLRQIQLQAETQSTVARLHVEKGQRVKAGELLLELAMNDRQARLQQAEALVRQHKSNLAATRRLNNRGLQAELTLKQAEAELAAAQAALEQIKLDIAHTRITAPFAGIINERPVELGGFVDHGTPVATLVDDSALLVTGQVPQQYLSQLQVGQPAQIELISGERLTGTLRYISALADNATRSYRVEVEVPNPEGKWAAGLSATLKIPVQTLQGHFLSASDLTLNTQGELGVKAVDSANHVVFHPVRLIRSQTDGVWVAGLPAQVDVITLGQGFVMPGEEVIPVPKEVPLAAVSTPLR